MKKLLWVVSALAVSASSAAVSSSSANVVGVLPVYSKSAQTIISIPWVGSGVSAGEIKVADIVKTDNLTPGDNLHYYNGTAYESWVLEAGTGGKAPTWASTTSVSANSNEQSQPAGERALSRGNAIILIRQNPTSGGAALPFYILGQVATTPAANTTLAAGTPENPVYSLVSPPVATNFNVNAATWASIDAAATLQYKSAQGTPVTLWRKNNAWVGHYPFTIPGTELTVDKVGPEGAVIPAGMGAWFFNTGSQVTVTWPQ